MNHDRQKFVQYLVLLIRNYSGIGIIFESYYIQFICLGSGGPGQRRTTGKGSKDGMGGKTGTDFFT